MRGTELCSWDVDVFALLLTFFLSNWINSNQDTKPTELVTNGKYMSLFQPTHPLHMLRTEPWKLMLALCFPKSVFFQWWIWNLPVRTSNVNFAADKNVELVSCVLQSLMKRAGSCSSDVIYSLREPTHDHTAHKGRVLCLRTCNPYLLMLVEKQFMKYNRWNIPKRSVNTSLIWITGRKKLMHGKFNSVYYHQRSQF